MSRQFAFPVFGAVAALLSFSAIPTSSGQRRRNLHRRANAAAPQGSHWYYRLDRATQRKCWRLVKRDQQPQSAAKQAAPQGEPADEADAAPAAGTSARVQSPQHGWLTRSASAVPETLAPTQGTPDRASEPATIRPPRRRLYLSRRSKRATRLRRLRLCRPGAEADERRGARSRGCRCRHRNDPIRVSGHRGHRPARGGDFLSRRSEAAAHRRAHTDRARGHHVVRATGGRGRPDVLSAAADAPDAAARRCRRSAAALARAPAHGRG